MNKTLIASAIALSTGLASVSAQANIDITQMNFSGISAASGSVLDAGGGSFTGSFFGHTWVADQVTGVLVQGDTWSGSNALGAWDYTDGLSNLSAGQNAVGTLFDWSTSIDIPVLAIFSCDSGVCTGVNTVAGQSMQTGPFVGSSPAFNGTGDLNPKTPEVPVPAAVWLFGSGLIGLVGVARRRKAA